MRNLQIIPAVGFSFLIACSSVGGGTDTDTFAPEDASDQGAVDTPLVQPDVPEVGHDASTVSDDGYVASDHHPSDIMEASDIHADLPGDTPVEVDVPAPPAGCCWEDADCDIYGSPVKMVCADVWVGPEPQYGVCKPVAEEGRCWRNEDCLYPEICHGYSVCPCLVNCDMEEMPGVCATPNAECVPIKEKWVKEYCDAANVVIFDGEKCLHTCLGCCWCEPFCDFTFNSMEECEAACAQPPQCEIFNGACDDAEPDEPWWYFDGVDCVMEDSCVCEGCPGTFKTEEQCEELCINDYGCTYLAALMDAPYGYMAESLEDLKCPGISPMDAPCETDDDCPIGAMLYGGSCVLGNCVYCWEDTQCEDGRICRAGRCVDKEMPCAPPPCTDFGCHAVTPSEAPCPVCVCDSIFDKECSEDEFCMVFSSHPYKRCVYGRCAECRNDDDCGQWGQCLPPGLCFDMNPPPHLLYGTWIIGWAGGMDHFSYFRFEPDGTLRRGSYEGIGAWADDIPQMPCWPGVEPPIYPLVGTWEPEITQSGLLVVRMSLNIACDSGKGWSSRFMVDLSEDGIHADFKDVDSDLQYMAARAPTDACVSDFATCKSPDWTWVYDDR